MAYCNKTINAICLSILFRVKLAYCNKTITTTYLLIWIIVIWAYCNKTIIILHVNSLTNSESFLLSTYVS